MESNRTAAWNAARTALAASRTAKAAYLDAKAHSTRAKASTALDIWSQAAADYAELWFAAWNADNGQEE